MINDPLELRYINNNAIKPYYDDIYLRMRVGARLVVQQRHLYAAIVTTKLIQE